MDDVIAFSHAGARRQLEIGGRLNKAATLAAAGTPAKLEAFVYDNADNRVSAQRQDTVTVS